MDLAIGAKQTWVMMDLLTKKGESKIVERCTYPLTGIACVKRIYTELCTLECTPQGLKLVDLVDGLSQAELERTVDLPIAPDLEEQHHDPSKPSSAMRSHARSAATAARCPRCAPTILGAIPLKALMARNPKVDWAAVHRRAVRLRQPGRRGQPQRRAHGLAAGRPAGRGARARPSTACAAPGLDALGSARAPSSRARPPDDRRRRREHEPRAVRHAQGRERVLARQRVYDTTIGWRFVNKRMKELYGVDSMPETAENVATDHKIEREAQDRMALASQLKAVAAQKRGFFDAEIVPVSIPQKKGEAVLVKQDEHPRETSLEALAKLKGVVRPDGTVTAGNASGVNDGSCALLLADEATAAKNGLTPRARVVGMATPACRRA
jgi:hypothetical protein